MSTRIVETKRLNLQGITEQDLLTLHMWRNSKAFCNFCSTRRNYIDLESFRDELLNDFKRDKQKQLIAFRKRDNKPIGTIWTYNLNLTDGHIFITTFVDPAYNKIGYGVEMFTSVVYSLFHEFPTLNKIYTEAYSYNIHSLSIMKKFGFLEEGVFLEHRLIDGIRYDLYRLAFYKKQFLEVTDFINKLLIIK